MPAFRPDVEGLRALAIALVLLSHSGAGVAEGGFVGVDVFFVISGFLITGMLRGELARTGRVSLVRFYARRIRRLMPQAVTAIAVVAGAAAVVLPASRADALTGDMVAAGGHAMNWHLAAESTDYFAAGEQDGPLDHFWSLAVEEQFYLAWPLILLVLAGRRRVIAALVLIAAASLAYAVHLVGAAPQAAYFSAPARAWELALGALLAVVLLDRRVPPRAAAAAGWAGLAAIVLAAIAYDAGTRFPGPAALLPTLGAAALVAAGTSASPSWPTRILALAPVQRVGRLSYAWYVWHWPALVFAAAAWGPLSPAEGLAVVAVSLAPTLATHRWIEEPIRRAPIRAPRITLAAAPAAAGVGLLAALALSALLPSLPTLAEAEGAERLETHREIQRSATALRPVPRDADADRGRSHRDGCLAEAGATTSPPCAYGDGRTTVVLFGDSHAMQHFPALERIAARRGWRLVQLAKAGCPPAAVSVVYAPSMREYPECDAWREHALRRIEREERPALVVVAGAARYTVVAGGRWLGADASTRALAAGQPAVLRRLTRAADRVAVIGGTPIPPFYAPDCVAAAPGDLARCAFARGPATANARTVNAAAAEVPGVRLVDPTSRFCMGDRCPSVIGDVLVYRNSGHVTATYAATLAPWLERSLALDAAAERPRGAAVLERTTALQRSADRVWPAPDAADGDRSRAYADGCLAADSATVSPGCVYGDPASDATVVLFGDSHALQFFPAIERIAARRGLRLVHLTKAGCPPADVSLPHYTGNPTVYRTCLQWREHALRRIERERPALIVAVGSSYYHVVEDGRILGRRASNRRLARGYVRTLERLRRAAGEVAAIRDTPRSERYAPDCVRRSMRALRRCAFARSGAFPRDDAIAPALRAAEGVAFVDATSRFCPRRLCPAVIGDALVYRNSSHVTATYAGTLSRWLERRLPLSARGSRGR